MDMDFDYFGFDILEGIVSALSCTLLVEQDANKLQQKYRHSLL